MSRSSAIILAALALAAPTRSAELESNFVMPPASARPWVYMFCDNGNLTKTGVTVASYYFGNYHPNDPRNEKIKGRGWSEWELIKPGQVRRTNWAATEWLFQGKQETAAWRNALSNTLSDPRCRYVCIFNWESIRSNEAVLNAVSELVEKEGRLTR